MTEHPILFNAAMVRAIIDGRKTQTRRMLKADVSAKMDQAGEKLLRRFPRQRGTGFEIGDRLWVRETCRAVEAPDGSDGVRYKADDAFIRTGDTRDAATKWLDLGGYGQTKSGSVPCNWVPSIHMPRWASRITLMVEDVRVQRLLDINDGDATAEGSNGFMPRAQFLGLWDSIYGPGARQANPWVVAITFRPVFENIDKIMEAA